MGGLDYRIRLELDWAQGIMHCTFVPSYPRADPGEPIRSRASPSFNLNVMEWIWSEIAPSGFGVRVYVRCARMSALKYLCLLSQN